MLALDVCVRFVNAEQCLQVVASASGQCVGQASGKVGQDIVLQIHNLKLWSPDRPFLYDLEVSVVSAVLHTSRHITEEQQHQEAGSQFRVYVKMDSTARSISHVQMNILKTDRPGKTGGAMHNTWHSTSWKTYKAVILSCISLFLAYRATKIGYRATLECAKSVWVKSWGRPTPASCSITSSPSRWGP